MGEKISCSNSDERDARKAHGFFSLFFFFFLTQSTRTYVFFHSINSHDRLRKEEGIALSPTEAFSPAHKLKKKKLKRKLSFKRRKRPCVDILQGLQNAKGKGCGV